MTTTYSFFLPIPPAPAQRTRATCRGRFASVYLDPKYREWRAVALEALRGINDIPAETFEGPVRFTLDALFQRPKTTKLPHPRADLDNLEKGLWDAVVESGRWFKDDNQITECRTTKRWAEAHETPGYAITIEFL